MIALSVIAAASMLYGITAQPGGRAARRSASIPRAQENIAPQTAQNIAAIGQIKRRAAKSKFTSFKRNPFVIKLSPASTQATNLVLGGIMWDKHNPRAMISNTVVKKGDRILGYTVTEINENGVVLNDGIKELELKLNDKIY